MACNCTSKNRATASGVAAVAGTYRVMMGDRKVYETTNDIAAKQVGGRFDNAVIRTPEGKTLVLVIDASGHTWVEQQLTTGPPNASGYHGR